MQALAILVAAGRGERMGIDQPKAFLPLAGIPLLLRAARPFELSPSIAGIVAVVPEGELDRARDLLKDLHKVKAIVHGGPQRQDSVLLGLREIPAGFDDLVLVHDAARPFVDVALIEAVCRSARDAGAALPVLGLVDTVKKVEEGRVLSTLDRSQLGSAQTPQGFRLSLLVRAYEAAFRDRVVLTDEAMAVERLGERVIAVPGSPWNRKITTPEDLAWAEAVLASGAGGQ
jgi:2-C-methyl-D-erythritol 4-phosphate cytidylyltransferase